MAIVPVVRGLYVCERVDGDPVSKNLTLHNCFRGFRLSALPGTPRPFFVVAYLANGLGPLSIRTTISSPITPTVVFSHLAEITAPDRLTEVRFVLQVFCRFPTAGSYDISLEVNGELIALSPFRVNLMEAREP